MLNVWSHPSEAFRFNKLGLKIIYLRFAFYFKSSVIKHCTGLIQSHHDTAGCSDACL